MIRTDHLVHRQYIYGSWQCPPPNRIFRTIQSPRAYKGNSASAPKQQMICEIPCPSGVSTSKMQCSTRSCLWMIPTTMHIKDFIIGSIWILLWVHSAYFYIHVFISNSTRPHAMPLLLQRSQACDFKNRIVGLSTTVLQVSTIHS